MLQEGICIVDVCKFLGTKSDLISMANEHSKVAQLLVFYMS